MLYHILFIHLCFDWHLVCFHVLTIVKNVAVIVGVHGLIFTFFVVLVKQIRLPVLLVTQKVTTSMHGSFPRLPILFLWPTTPFSEPIAHCLNYFNFIVCFWGLINKLSLITLLQKCVSCIFSIFSQIISCQVLKRKQMEFCFILYCPFSWFREN